MDIGTVQKAQQTILGTVQVWEQEVAWTEAEKPIKLAARALTLPNHNKLNKAPIFCFETMMHMLYWSCLVYDYKRVGVLHFSYLLVGDSSSNVLRWQLQGRISAFQLFTGQES